MPAANFAMTGMDELVRKLERLEPKNQRRALRRAVGKAGNEIVKDARKRVATNLGLLKLSLGRKDKVYKRSNTAVSVVGARTRFKGKKAESIRAGGGRASKARPANYAHLVEFGTKPHAIRGRGGFLAFAGIVTRVVNHPGSRPKPFLRPAFAAKRVEALSVAAKSLREDYAKAVKR